MGDMRSRERVRQAKTLSALYDKLTSMSAQCQNVTVEEAASLKQTIQDAKSVVSDKELVKNASKVLAALESQADSRQSKFEASRSQTLAGFSQAAMGPPARGSKRAQRRLLVPIVLSAGLLTAFVLFSRRHKKLGSSVSR